MNSFDQSKMMNDSRDTSRRNSSQLFSNRTLDNSMASRQSRENSLISTNRYKSPFYEGKVSFGGASAKRVRLSQVMPYNIANKPTTITRIKDSDIKRSSEFDQLSNATKNMLDNIYKASSPLEDAKRIPVFTSTASQLSSDKFLIDKPFKRLSSLRTPKLVSNLKTTSPLDREKLQLKWEELENSSLMNTSTINQDSINNLIADASSHHSSYQHDGRIGGKMRNRITKTNRTSKWQLEDDYPSPLEYELPNVSLPINSNSLPTFNLNRRSNTESNVNSLKRPLISITREDDSSDGFDEFRFSAPKVIKLEKISDSFYKDSIRKNISDLPKVTTNPIINKTPSQQQPQVLDNKTPTINFNIPQVQQPSLKPPLTNINTTTTTSSDLKNLETNKTVEMYKLDKLESDFNPKENKATLANTNLPIKSTTDSKLSNSFNYDGLADFSKSNFMSSNKKWTCDSCGVKNENNETKCIACSVLRLKESKDKNVSNIYSNYSFGTINLEKKGFNAFKLDSNATTDLISKPTSIVSNSSLSSTTAPSLTIPSTNLLTNNAKIELSAPTIPIIQIEKSITDNKPTLQNNNETTITNSTIATTATTLASTFSTKPAVTTDSKPFNFITNEVADKIDNKTDLANSTWDSKFLAPKGNWTCPSCMASNQPTHKKCPCCEEPNPNEPKKPKDEKTASTISFNSNSSTGGFNFNLTPSTTSTPASTGFSFTNKLTSIKTSTSSTDSNQSKGFSFANPATVTKSSDQSSSTAPKFTFGLTSTTTSSDVSSTTTTTTKPINEPIKQLSSSLNSDNKTSSSLFSLPPSTLATSAQASFTFGQPTKETTSLISKPLNDQLSNKPISSSNFIFGSGAQSNNTTSTTTNLNNGELLFNLSSSTNQQVQPTNTFSLNSSNNSSTPANLNSFNQFGASTATSNNLFGTQTSLTNGFGTPATDNNLFSNSIANAAPAVQAPINFPVFQSTPVSFNFGSTGDQSQNSSSVFQFSAPKSDASIVQQQTFKMNNLQGRNIKKARRRLGKE